MSYISVHKNVFNPINSFMGGQLSAENVTNLLIIYLRESNRVNSSFRLHQLGSPTLGDSDSLEVSGYFNQADVRLCRYALKRISRLSAQQQQTLAEKTFKAFAYRKWRDANEQHNALSAILKKVSHEPLLSLSLKNPLPPETIGYGYTNRSNSVDQSTSPYKKTIIKEAISQLKIYEILKNGVLKACHYFIRKTVNAVKFIRYHPVKFIYTTALYSLALLGAFSLSALLFAQYLTRAAMNENQPHQPPLVSTQPSIDPAIDRSVVGNLPVIDNKGQIEHQYTIQPEQPAAQNNNRDNQSSFYAQLPRDIEIVTGKAGQPNHIFYVFADPLCPSCKEFEPVLEQVALMPGIEMHLFPVPLHKDARDMISGISCAADQTAKGTAWSLAINYERTSPFDCESGKTAPDRSLAFYRSIGIKGTPSVINAAGEIHSGGFATAAEMVKFLEKP